METITVLDRKNGVDTRELRQLTKDFKDWKPDKQIKAFLRGAGLKIAEDAKVIVEPHSKTTPATIKPRISKTRVSVVAGGQGHPISGLLELGNKGRGKSQAATRRGTFRHPVFGNRSVWVDQKRFPYLLPAAIQNEHSLEALEGKMVADAFREYRFPMSRI